MSVLRAKDPDRRRGPRASKSLKTALVPTTDPRWPEWLDNLRHDVYHLPEYFDLATRYQETGEAIAFVAEQDTQRLFVPMVARTISEELGGDGLLRDATSPRGYPGPLMHASADVNSLAFLDTALAALSAVLREQRIVSLFVRLHPLFALPVEVLGRHGAIVDHGDAVAIDLALTADELWHQTRRDHRRDINKAKRLGHVVRIDEGWEHLDGFLRAYAQTMDRLGAAPRWRLTREYFSDLHQSLGERIHLCVYEAGDELAAGALLSEVDGVVEYHLSGTLDGYADVSPSKSIIHFARAWAKARGNRVLHLAGSLYRGDSLSQFKLGFSPLQYPVHSWRVISDPPAYERLCRTWSTRQRAAIDPPEGFFPAYRKP